MIKDILNTCILHFFCSILLYINELTRYLSEFFLQDLAFYFLCKWRNCMDMIFSNFLWQCYSVNIFRKPSVIVWLFALLFEMSWSGSLHRIHGLFERALANDKLHNSVLLWRLYVAYEINIVRNPSAARRIFFRAIHACPW